MIKSSNKTATLNLLTNESNEPATIELTGSRVALGRAVTNDVMINSAHVSRRHVLFVLESNKWLLKDLSTNGVSVNSKKIPKDKFITLNNEDKIALVPTGALQYQIKYITPTSNLGNSAQTGTSVNLTPKNPFGPCMTSERIKSVVHDVRHNRSMTWGSQNENNDVPSQNGSALGTSKSTGDIKSSQYKNLWKRPRKIETNSSDSDEPKNSKMMRVVIDGDCSESSDSDDGGVKRKLKLAWAPGCTKKLSLPVNTADNESSVCAENVVPGKNDNIGLSRTDSKRRSEEQISSLKIKIQKLESEKLTLTKEKRNLESKLAEVRTEASAEKQEIFADIMQSFGTEFSCSICTEIFIEPTVVNCGHTFCSFCITQWLKEKSICAICRKPVSSHSRHVEMNNLLNSVISKMPQAIMYKRQNDLRDREEAVQLAHNRARAEANRPRQSATLGRNGTFIPEENFVSFLLSRHFFAQVVERDREPRPRPVTVSVRTGRIFSNSRNAPSPPPPPRPLTPPRRRSARIQVRNQTTDRNSD